MRPFWKQCSGIHRLGGSCLVILLLCTISACAPAISRSLRQQAEPQLSFAALSSDPDVHQGKIVILGGVIAQTTPKPGRTEVEVVQKPLDYFQEPQTTDTSLGRFLVVADRFLDPLVFRKDRKITVAGPVQGSEVRPLGDMAYRYPVVTGQEVKLWPIPRPDPFPYRWGFGVPVYYYWGPWGPGPFWLW
ncbi:MAG: Slp family lipoprotein [Desulfobacca sp.]|uniref:Slp family lipoprotein n=1 Tax=Desulfobacca sp. TaxID=2067990 RepID=UPI004049FCB0